MLDGIELGIRTNHTHMMNLFAIMFSSIPIFQDVPTNLRAVKKAAKEVGLKGVLAKRNRGRYNSNVEQIEAASGFADFILDFENETLGAYMK